MFHSFFCQSTWSCFVCTSFSFFGCVNLFSLFFSAHLISLSFSIQINDMTKELDMLLHSIEQPGGFRDACTVLQKSSLEALEQGILTLSDKWQKWRVILFT